MRIAICDDTQCDLDNLQAIINDFSKQNNIK